MPPKTSRRKALHILESRVKTFSSARFKLKKGRSREFTWPHSEPSAELVAQSGFYFTPDSAKEGVDSVTCYMCGCCIKGWEPEDIPDKVHYDHSPNCSVATLRYKPWEGRNNANDIRIHVQQNPHCESSILVRLQTFFYPLTDSQISQTLELQSSGSQFKKFMSVASPLWPHDEKKNFRPSSLRLALAGFYYTAEKSDGDDLCQCPYCGVSLDRWLKEDDPLGVHRELKPECYFFKSQAKFSNESANFSEAEIEEILFASSKDKIRSGTESSANSQESDGYESTSSIGSARSNSSKRATRTRSKKRTSEIVFTDDESDSYRKKKRPQNPRKDANLKAAFSSTVLKPEPPRTRATRSSSIAASTAKAAASARAEARAASSSPRKFRLSAMDLDEDSQLMKPLPTDGRPLSDIISGAFKSPELRGVNHKFSSQATSTYDSMASFSGVRVTHSGSVSERISRFEELTPGLASNVSSGAQPPRSPLLSRDAFSPKFSPKPANGRAAFSRKAKQDSQPSAIDLVLNRSQNLKEQYEKASSATTSLFGRSGNSYGASSTSTSFSHRTMKSVSELPEPEDTQDTTHDQKPNVDFAPLDLEPFTPLTKKQGQKALENDYPHDPSVIVLGTPSVDYIDRNEPIQIDNGKPFHVLTAESGLGEFAKQTEIESQTEIYQDPEVEELHKENHEDSIGHDNENMLPLPPPIGEAAGNSENWSRLSDASSMGNTDHRNSGASLKGALPLRPSSPAQRNTGTNSPRNSIQPPLEKPTTKQQAATETLPTRPKEPAPTVVRSQSPRTGTRLGTNTGSPLATPSPGFTSPVRPRSGSALNNYRLNGSPTRFNQEAGNRPSRHNKSPVLQASEPHHADEGNEADDEGDSHSTKSILSSPGKNRYIPLKLATKLVDPVESESIKGPVDHVNLNSPADTVAPTTEQAAFNPSSSSPVNPTEIDTHTPERQTATLRPPFGTVARYSAVKAAARATSPRSAAPKRGPVVDSPSASVSKSQHFPRQPHFPLPQETPPAPTPGKRVTPGSGIVGTACLGSLAEGSVTPLEKSSFAVGDHRDRNNDNVEHDDNDDGQQQLRWTPIDEDCVFDVMTEFEHDVDIMLGRSLLREEDATNDLAMISLDKSKSAQLTSTNNGNSKNAKGDASSQKNIQLEQWLEKHGLMDKTVKDFYTFLGQLSQDKLTQRFEALYSKLESEVQRSLSVLESIPTVD